MKALLFYFGIIGFMVSCGTTTPKSTDNPVTTEASIKQKVDGCMEIVEIMNYTHDSDCQYLLKMENGTLLFPAELPANDKVAFYNGAGLKIGYEVIEVNDKNIAQVACKQHDYLVKVTCMEQFVIQEKGMPSTHEECVSIKNPYKFNWMRNAITSFNPKLVSEYPYNPGFIYEFKTDESSILFDCLGNQICDTNDNQDCASLLAGLTDPKVILVVNN